VLLALEVGELPPSQPARAGRGQVLLSAWVGRRPKPCPEALDERSSNHEGSTFGEEAAGFAGRLLGAHSRRRRPRSAAGYTPPIDMLKGSLFASYTVPGLALMLLVGGSAMVATWLQSKRHPLGPQISLVSGLMLMAFEAVALLVVGYAWLLRCHWARDRCPVPAAAVPAPQGRPPCVSRGWASASSRV